MSILSAKFVDFDATVRRVRELADTPFNEAAWKARVETFAGWNLRKNDHLDGRHVLIIDERGDLFRNNEAYDPALDPDALIKFDDCEFSFWLDYLWDERLSSSKARAKFADAFADTSRAVCEALGEPDQRLHYVHEVYQRMTFCACVWELRENSLLLIQDIGDMQGLEGIVEFRILPRGPKHLKLPRKSPFR
jgi:hypothetical protein